jgi:hypothetical protein
MTARKLQQKSMFLPGVEQNPKPTTYLELIEAAREFANSARKFPE